MQRLQELRAKTPSYPVQFVETALLKSTKELAEQNVNKENAQLSTTHLAYGTKTARALNDSTRKPQVEVQMLNKATLQFTGYFEEPVEQSRLETRRTRHLDIRLYLEDNSLEIIEPKQRNSGMVQGIFLKRKCLHKPSTTQFFTAYDFRIQEVTEILGKKIHITGCDAFTRDFYCKLNLPQPENVNAPASDFETKVLRTFDIKDHNGLNSYVHNGRVPSQRQFLENDRKVLRFYATMDSEPFIIYYFLSDDCVEICQVPVPNSGKDSALLYLRRQKVPKNYQLSFQESLKECECLGPADFEIGKELQVLGKGFVILGCDPWTSRFYKELGRDFPVYQKQQTVEEVRPAIELPPSNGFGTEEDSLQNVLRLVPKPPKKDFYALMDVSECLQFVCLMAAQEVGEPRR